LLWAHLVTFSLIGGAILAAGVMIAAAALTGAPLRPASSAAGVVIALSFGWLFFVASAFGFYAFWAYYPAVWAATAFVALAALIAPGLVRTGTIFALATAVVAVAAPVAAYLATPPADAVMDQKNTFRIETYNIHQGFNAGQIPSLDTLVDVISQEQPDVLCLQEVARG